MIASIKGIEDTAFRCAYREGWQAALIRKDDVAAAALKADRVQLGAARLPQPNPTDITTDHAAAAFQYCDFADVNACQAQFIATASQAYPKKLQLRARSRAETKPSRLTHMRASACMASCRLTWTLIATYRAFVQVQPCRVHHYSTFLLAFNDLAPAMHTSQCRPRCSMASDSGGSADTGSSKLESCQ